LDPPLTSCSSYQFYALNKAQVFTRTTTYAKYVYKYATYIDVSGEQD